MKWTAEAWKCSEPIFEQITKHPFITELAAGTLATDKFVRYIAQDEIYIKNYGEEMYLLADMLPEGDMRTMFRAFADSGIEAERAMHDLLIERFGIDTAVEASSVTKEYMSHTRGCINGDSFEVALASMLPCMWIYNEVGLFIYAHRNREANPYSEWVATYSSEEFTAGVAAVLEMCDSLAAKATPEVRRRMTEAYHKAAYLEWAFWDYGYSGENGQNAGYKELAK